MASNILLLEMLNEYVAGHEEAKKALIVMIKRSQLRVQQKYMKSMEDSYLVNPLKILLLGKSGTGKTFLMDSLQKICRFPLLKLDATQLNPTGAIGGVKAESLPQMIREEATKCCREYPTQFPYLEYAIDQTVVFVDEFDKLSTSFEGGSNNWNKHTQTNFLTLFDNKDDFKGVSFVFAGAFDAVVSKPTIKRLGFNAQASHDAQQITLDEEIVRMGLIPELVGRINAIIRLDELKKEDYLRILDERLMPKKRIDLAAVGVFDIELTTEQKDELASKSIKSGQGVRFLQRELDKLFLDAEFEADSICSLL